jgi:hypothetical protein
MNAREAKSHLAELLRRERDAMADFILALAQFDQKRLWRDLEYASLFSFLRSGLGLSAGAAQYRKTAAELVQRYPEVEQALRQGKLCLSSTIELAKVLTPENVSEVLPRFFGLSSRDAAAVAVSIRPVEHPPEREVVTPIRSAAPVQFSAALTVASPCAPTQRPSVAVPSRAEDIANELPLENGVRAPEVPAIDTTSPPGSVASVARTTAIEPRPSVEPLDGERARLHITVSRRLLEKLDAAKAALSHSHPGASSEEVLEAALDLLLAQRAKRKGIVVKPRNTAGPVKPETIPAAVKREVWTRAGGRCEWKLESGVCGSTLRLEFDHILPRAMGGPSTVENVRLTCRSHNLLAARQAFGDEWMNRFTSAARSVGSNAARSRGPSIAPTRFGDVMPGGDSAQALTAAPAPSAAPRR